MALTLTSPAFRSAQMIPAEFTADGDDRSPPLVWSGVPSRVESFAVLCDDPDAPGGAWVHWVLFDLPAELRELPAGVPATPELENGARQGTNGWGRIGWGGPDPPGGIHRYVFTLLALDRRLDLPAGATAVRVLDAAKGRVVLAAELTGRYRKR